MWIRTPDFRKALSLATDRNNMSEVVCSGSACRKTGCLTLPFLTIPATNGSSWTRRSTSRAPNRSSTAWAWSTRTAMASETARTVRATSNCSTTPEVPVSR